MTAALHRPLGNTPLSARQERAYDGPMPVAVSVSSEPVPSPGGRGTRRQVAALPYRKGEDGRLLVLLVTSRTTRRWIVPKGWPMKQMKAREAAAREAYEEAGVRGKIASKPFGRFFYEKRADDRHAGPPCEVQVYPLHVKRQVPAWPEQHQREQRWLPAEEAAALVGDEGLGRLIQAFAASADLGS